MQLKTYPDKLDISSHEKLKSIATFFKCLQIKLVHEKYNQYYIYSKSITLLLNVTLDTKSQGCNRQFLIAIAQ